LSPSEVRFPEISRLMTSGVPWGQNGTGSQISANRSGVILKQHCCDYHLSRMQAS
jgi:hypothetical protein